MSLAEIIEKHDAYRKNCLNLQASENYLSPKVRSALSSDMASRYSMVFDEVVHGIYVHNAYGGTKYQEEILNAAKDLAKKIFGFKFACVRPISGHVAAMAAVLSATHRGDKIMAISPEIGGYDGYSPNYLPDMFGLKYVPLPLKEMRFVDTEAIRREKPQVIILGASYILFPYNLSEVLDVAEEIDAKVLYDASHVLGLLPSGFQKDIERCDLVYGSTHKSFPGPQGGMIFTNNQEMMEKVEKNLTWRVQDNYHSNRVAALALALEEFQGVAEIYGKRVAENSHQLGKSLHSQGLGIKYPPEFSKSHQLLIEERELERNFGLKAPEMSRVLEKNNIIVDCVGRIGTSEVTWKSYGQEDMEEIADLIIQALKGIDVRDRVRKIVEKWDGKTLGEKYSQRGIT